MVKLQEIVATFLTENHRFENNSSDDVIIGDARFVEGHKPESVKGVVAIKGPVTGSLTRHLSYRFFGHWATYKGKDQFHFRTFVLAKPHGRAGVIAYLLKQGTGLGIGPSRAEILWDTFAGEAVRICREEPEVAASVVLGWTLDLAELLSEKLKQIEHLEGCFIDLSDLFEKRGFPRSVVKDAINLWGVAAKDVIRRSPYVLMRFRGCGFRRCDEMYLDLGHPPDRLKRQALCAWYTVASDSSGDTWFPIEFAINGMKNMVGATELRINDAMKLAKRSGILSFRRIAGDRIDPERPRIWVAETKNADQEAAIARYLVDSQSEAPAWPVDLAGLTEHQLQAVALATKGSIGSLGGGPGTGKTYCAASLIHAAINHVGREKIGVAAPTGKAAVRITEVMKGYGVPIQAKTIHSLLQVEQQQDGSGWQFFYRSGRPLPLRYLIVDEASMIDTSLMCNLLAARGKGTHLLFVGDIHQLPPVGHGAPLRDMIAAGIPYGELLEIQRQAAGSLIVRACHAIRNGSANYETLHTLDEVNLG